MIKGCDLSHFNGNVDFSELIKDEINFDYLKATEGTFNIDQTFIANAKKAMTLGLPVGAYHFFRPGLDGTEQARHFLGTIASTHLSLPPVLDWETSDGMRTSIQKLRARSFLDNVKAITGKMPLIYGSPSFLADLGLDDSYLSSKLWTANYGVHQPKIPRPWSNWTFWQYTDTNGMDLDYFNGTVEQLKLI